MHSIIFYRDMKHVLLVVQRSKFVALRSRACFDMQFFPKALKFSANGFVLVFCLAVG